MKTSLLFLISLGLLSWARSQDVKMSPLMPMPAKVQPSEGRFLVDNSFAIEFPKLDDQRVDHAVARFLNTLSRRTEIRFSSEARKANFLITCKSPGEKIQKLGEDESYRLEVTSTEVHLDAPNPLGVIHGLQTFLQLVQKSPEGFVAPAVVIEDVPRFPWRGLLIDVSRHFMPVGVIKRNLDGMEAVKFNVLHWHLSDDQGFRVESKKFPKFQQMSSDGSYYTQEQIKDVIAYAGDRGIRVVPEFDMPGHTTSWFAAYPELASGPGPYRIWHHFGVHDSALDGFIGEMSRLFADQYFHIGGDEVNGKQWDANQSIRAFKRRHHMKSNLDLQAWFNLRLQQIVTKHGKIMMGWDEILHADLPKDVVVQSWRGQQSLAAASRQGYRGLLSFGYYLDLMQPASQHYSIDPLADAAAGLSAEEKQRVLGGEACMWAEFITPENIDERIWPRAAAIAERLWSAQDVRDLDSMYTRLQSVSEELESIGLMHQAIYRTMLERLAGGTDPQPLRVLADVLEPVKEYVRPETKVYETTTPLNRLVDAVHPESDTGRQFASMVQRLLNKSASPEEISTMRNWLTAWEKNDEPLEPSLHRNALLQEVTPISRDMTVAATAGLHALDYLSNGGRAPSAWREQQLQILKQAQEPKAEMLNTIVPSVQKLVAATTPE
jgi:hexosaminidase